LLGELKQQRRLDVNLIRCVSHGIWAYICVYPYSLLLKIDHELYLASVSAPPSLPLQWQRS